MNNIFSFLQESTQLFPEKVFIIDNGKQWTYAETLKKVLLFADYLSEFEINKEDRIIIFLDNSFEYIIAFFASLLVNSAIVPINKNTSTEYIQFIINETKPKVFISNKINYKKLGDSINFTGINKIYIDYEQNNIGKNITKTLLVNLCCDIDNLALILYTSGTTRMPKGVMLTHNNLIANTDSILKYLPLNNTDSILLTISFSYSYGNSLLLTHTKVGGAINIENRVAYPLKILEELQTSKMTGFSTVGSYLNVLLKHGAITNLAFSNIKYITFAGESTYFEDIQKLNKIAPHLKIYIMYGQTEASARLSCLDPELLFKKPGSIGRGIPNVILRVVSEDGSDVVAGEIGEIIAYGDNIMKGYWNNEEETKIVIKEGWLYTGDLATVDSDGYIYIKGRKKDIIKYLGHRLSPLEIEAVINMYEGIFESAVVEVENENIKQIKAYVVLKDDILDIERINLYLRSKLPSYKRPHIIEVVNAIPRTLNGKIKRSELREINNN